MKIEISDKYKQLFNILNERNTSPIDTIIVTGGRGSGKSFVVSLFTILGCVNLDWKTVYTRFTDKSIGDSIREEVSEKIDILNLETKLKEHNRKIVDKNNNVKIAFKGLKTGSKNQKANLKSIKGFNVWVLDESEECPDFETFQRIYLSIRSVDKQNLSILVLNPAYKLHWIYQHFFLKNGVQGGFNGVKDNVMYLHTSFLDMPKGSLPKNILNEYARMREDNPEMYRNVVEGGWIDDPEGVLIPFRDVRLIPMDYFYSGFIRNVCFIDPAERNGDMMSAIFCRLSYNDTDKFKCHVYDIIHSNSGFEVLSAIINQKAIVTGVDEVIFEKNGVGLATGVMLKSLNSDNKYKLTPYHSTENKEAKILANYEFVKRHFAFNAEYNESKQYNLFLNHLTTYSTEINEPHTKDAMDVCCSASKILKIIYKKLL